MSRLLPRLRGPLLRPLLRGPLLGGRRDDPPAHPLPAGTPAAEARGASVRLGARTVLDGVDLALLPGEVLALVGPNGAGKSTLLGALAADTPLTSGAVHLAGRPATDWSPRELAARRAVLPQAAGLAFPFTVEEVVRMGRAPWARTPREEDDEDAVAEAMAATEVAGFAARRFSALSGGERARVALARVLAQRAPVLLLDEPTAALDLRHQELVLRLCRERAAAGDAVAIVLHDLGLAAAYAHRIALLDTGRLTSYGPPSEVLTPETLTRVYHHPVEVLAHPATGAHLVLPVRPPQG
ncbi:heme ABC transporter ATP-binding protein [Streptomyces iconiensis]|uniref:Heme ABC transporter ATP-binding protein n=1 Tax=Streptomyces iconiensis TaxID=1384038 RepID=A0ABT6ZXX9_9ACTN|nr:heme ABC transporter ATP-binding protein [Streptomyces iconiensis]MDJ1133496.1 heme ABC transporter ATP-binding protein [Streptomyces iconiensis]